MANPKKSVSWRIIAVTVTLISLCALCAPANAGVSPDVGRSIGNAMDGTFTFIGETNLTFVDTNGTLILRGYLISAWENSNINIPFPNSGIVFDSKKEAYRLLPGFYKVTDLVGGEKTRIYFASKDELRVETKVCGEPFLWVTRGGDITFKADTKLHNIKGSLPNNITYKLLNPKGLRVPEYKVGVPLSDIDVSENGENITMINTAGLDLGVYTLSIETDPATNNGLDVEGPAVTFEVKDIGVTIEAKPKEQTVTEEIVFTLSTTPNTTVTLNVTVGIESNVWFEKGKGAGEVKIGGHSASGISDKQGNFKAVANFTVTGAYKITATELFTNTTDDTWVKIIRYVATLDEPKEGVYHIGEVLKIKGSAPTAADNVTIKVDGAFLDNISVTKFGTGYDWNTEGIAPGTYKIAIWVLPQSDPERDPSDASVSIVLIRGGLIVETSADFVALGDDFEIEKIIAPGRDRVDILTIAPDGGGGRGFEPIDVLTETDGELNAPGLTHYSYSKNPAEAEFKKEDMEKIAVGKDVDTGTYLIAVLNPGQDGVWGKSGDDNLLKVITYNYSTPLAVKTTDQLLAILKDRTINAAGSDDLLGIATIKVENGFVTLDNIADVPLGQKIEVTGTTNRQVDTSIIVTVEGVDESIPKLKPKIAKAKEDDKTFYNTFSISFETASANIGKYVVTADDGDGHIASTTVTILPAEEPSVDVSATPTPETPGQEQGTNESATATPQMTTPTTTPTPRTETEKEPGFETIFSIAGLLAVTWLLRRRKRRFNDRYN